jgi:hypothetical protein
MKALEIGSVTLVGVYGEPPHEHGNCFDVKCDDGLWRRVLNFNHENLEALEKVGLTWPIECEVLSERTVVIMDPRIGERWYQQYYCTVCTPQNLLPITQRQRQLRDIARGLRVESTGLVILHYRDDNPQSKVQFK